MFCRFLLERVKKDRLLLGFVEKLLVRFRVATNGRQCQDIAFCLNQLTYNDKSFKVVKDNLNSYHDKLGDEYVFDAFNTIIASLRKNAKPELKVN
jgi:condensin complex subunit 1